jgi:hypothetical protein
MNAVLIIGGLFLLYEVLTRGSSAPYGFYKGGPFAGQPIIPEQPQTGSIVQQGQVVQAPGFTFHAPSAMGPNQGTMMIGSTVATSSSIISSGQIGTALGLAGTTLGTAIPIVGAAFAAIFSALMAASAKRAAEARAENDAVANEVPAWDNAVDQIVAAYNSGQISAGEAGQLLASPQTKRVNLTTGANGAVWQAYWNVVCPKVQPGRNGCQCGTIAHNPAVSLCSGSYGAGCCVGYDNLDNGQLYVLQAIAQADQTPGRAVTSQMIPTVYASKYGGINRPGYTITVQKPVSTMLQL